MPTTSSTTTTRLGQRRSPQPPHLQQQRLRLQQPSNPCCLQQADSMLTFFRKSQRRAGRQPRWHHCRSSLQTAAAAPSLQQHPAPRRSCRQQHRQQTWVGRTWASSTCCSRDLKTRSCHTPGSRRMRHAWGQATATSYLRTHLCFLGQQRRCSSRVTLHATSRIAWLVRCQGIVFVCVVLGGVALLRVPPSARGSTVRHPCIYPHTVCAHSTVEGWNLQVSLHGT